MTEAMPFLQKYDITFLRPPTIGRGSFFRVGSALFAEVGKAEAGGGLVFPLFADTDRHQHDDGNDIREHLNEGQQAHGDIEIIEQDIQRAKQIAAEDGHGGLPGGKDDDGDGEPAAVAEAVIGPDTIAVIHDVEQAAKAGNHAADAGGKVFITGNIDTRGIGSGGVFAHGAQVQAGAAAAKEQADRYRQNDGEIDQKAIGEEQLTDGAHAGGKG